MKTKQLLRALKLAGPALDNRAFLPVLTHFCFAGDHLYAFDDKTAIIVFEETGLECAVPGRTLLELLTDAGDEIEISKKGEHVLIKDGKHELTIPALPDKSFAFEVPDVEGDVEFDVSEGMIKALDFVASCSNVNTVDSYMMGVTFTVDGKTLTLFSSDNVTCTRAVLDIKQKKAKARAKGIITKNAAEVICKLYRDLSDVLESASLIVTDKQDYVIVQYAVKDDAAPVILVCRTTKVEKFCNYEEIFAGFLADGDDLQKVPADLAVALRRCATVTATDIHPVVVIDATKKSKLGIDCKGAMGKVQAQLDAKGHPATCVVRCAPARAARALESCDHIAVHEKGLTFRGAHEGYVVDYIVEKIADSAE